MTIRVVAAHSLLDRAIGRATVLQGSDAARLYVVEWDPLKEPNGFRVLAVSPKPVRPRRFTLPAGRLVVWVPPARLRSVAPAEPARLRLLPGETMARAA